MKNNKLLVLSFLALVSTGCGLTSETSVMPSSIDNSETHSVIESVSEGSENSTVSVSESQESTIDEYDPENFDFGDPESWAGDNIKALDLGDCIFDTYTYDERYDWGQSIMYEDGVYKMWWCRHSRYDSIWYAESEDLKNWHDAQKVLVVTSNTTWLKMHVGKPTVIKVDGEYKMFFESPATLNHGYKEFDNNVFLAESTDGKNWSVWTNGGDEPYPVLRMSDEEMARSWDFSNTNVSGYGFYGFGQPSVCYVDGYYYLYYTHTLDEGDRMYVTKSKTCYQFDRGEEAFVRAGSGVKYNDLTKKFMMAFEYNFQGQSKIYYMESEDSIHFTYRDYSSCVKSKDIINRNTLQTHGYPDFVCNPLGHVDTETVYCAYMEGKMADSGNDWRQYSATWDIHIAAFNPKEFANREIVLPNNRVYNEKDMEIYKKEHVAYEDISQGISKISTAPIIDGKMDDIYSSFTCLKAERTVCEQCAVPGEVQATTYVAYDVNYLYLYVDVFDTTIDDSDNLFILIDEKKYAKSDDQISHISFNRYDFICLDGNGALVSDVTSARKEKTDGYAMEIRYPWRFKTTQEPYDEIGFDFYVFDNEDSTEYSSIKAWNDFKIRYDIKKAGSLYFRKS